MCRTPYVPCGTVFVLVAIFAEIMQQTITFFFILFFSMAQTFRNPIHCAKGKILHDLVKE